MNLNDPSAVAEITALFEHYEAALTGNDISALNGFFWNDPYGVGECLHGYDAIASFRQVRAGGSPPRRLERTVITTFGTDLATVNTEFRREGEARTGRQSQTWVRLPEGWRIVAAHVSLQAETS